MRLLNMLRAVAVLACAGTAALALFVASPAVARKTSMYAGFNHCPTAAPQMNDPANRGSACLSTVIHDGFLRLGNIGAEFPGPVHMQAGLYGSEEEAETLNVVPGSTTVEGAPVTLPNPFAPPPTGGSGGNPTPPPIGTTPPPPTKKKHHRRRHRRHHKRHHRRHHKQHRRGADRLRKGWAGVEQLFSGAPRGALPSAMTTAAASQEGAAGSSPVIEVFVEPAGDLRNLVLATSPEGEGAAFELPVKAHLVGSGLGPQCYIGSDAAPIVIAPKLIEESNAIALAIDPNGFEVKVIGIGGEGFEDATLAVPSANGCGELPGSLDPAINALIGLPAATGRSQVYFGDVSLELVGAEYTEGATLVGGAALQAAFEAAQQ